MAPGPGPALGREQPLRTVTGIGPGELGTPAGPGEIIGNFSLHGPGGRRRPLLNRR